MRPFLLILIMTVTLAYMAGFNKGMNSGWDAAVQYEPQCRIK